MEITLNPGLPDLITWATKSLEFYPTRARDKAEEERDEAEYRSEGFKVIYCWLWRWREGVMNHRIQVSSYLVTQLVKNMPVIQETWVWSLGQEDSLEKGMAIHSSILAWRIPCAEKPGELQFMELQRVRHDWSTNTFTFLEVENGSRPPASKEMETSTLELHGSEFEQQLD